jgi:hypothetical protein
MSEKLKNKICKAEKLDLHTLWGNVDLNVLPADKGNGAVVLNTSDYTEKVFALLDDPVYKNPTPCKEWKTSVIERFSLPEVAAKRL